YSPGGPRGALTHTRLFSFTSEPFAMLPTRQRLSHRSHWWRRNSPNVVRIRAQSSLLAASIGKRQSIASSPPRSSSNLESTQRRPRSELGRNDSSRRREVDAESPRTRPAGARRGTSRLLSDLA